MTETTTFKVGDKVVARYGALLDENGEPMAATVLQVGTMYGKEADLIRYRCSDGSATDSWEPAENLERVEGKTP